MKEKMNLNLFGAMEDESVDSVSEILDDNKGMNSTEAILIAILTEIRRLNDTIGSLGVPLSDIGRIAECVDEKGRMCITGTIFNCNDY